VTVEAAKAILVVGMHRSGTSALAGALSLLGIPLGDRLLKPGPDNPKGYWEHGDIVAVHEQLLAELGSRWDDVRALPEGWLSGEPARRAALAIGAILERDFGSESLWAVKDPRLCRLLPLWLHVLDRMQILPCVLFIARNPSEVSASLHVRNCWAPPFGEVLWLRYVTDALAASKYTPREVVLFDDLLVQPLVVTQIALTRLGVAIPELDDELRSTVESFVSATNRHHRQTATLKVGLNTLGGFRNEVTFVLTGLDIEAKAALVREQLSQFEDATWTLHGTLPVSGTRTGRAAIIDFLLGPDSRMLCGSILFADGGTDAQLRARDFPSRWSLNE